MNQQMNLLTFAIALKSALMLRDSTLAYIISLQQSALFGIVSSVTEKLGMLVIIEIDHKIVVFL